MTYAWPLADKVLRFLSPLKLEGGTPLRTALVHWQISRIRRQLAPEVLRSWAIDPRGFGKTTLNGALALALAACAPEGFRCDVYASDKDQAGYLLAAVRGFVRRNPAETAGAHLQRDRLTWAGNTVSIQSADVASAYGGTPHLTVIAELDKFAGRHSAAYELWTAAWSARGKVPGGKIWIESNAPVMNTWQHKLYKRFAGHAGVASWYLDHRENPALPAWLDPEERAADADVLPAIVTDRLYRNLITAAQGDYITPAEWEACIEHAPRRPPDRPGVPHVLALDHGRTSDRAALLVAHRAGRLIIVDQLEVWEPRPDEPVTVATIETAAERALAQFPGIRLLVADPWQLAGVCERMARRVKVIEFSWSGAHQQQCAELLRAAVRAAEIRAPPDEDLADEVCQLVVRQMSYGWRVDHKAGKHNDRATVLMMALWALARHRPARPAQPRQVGYSCTPQKKALPKTDRKALFEAFAAHRHKWFAKNRKGANGEVP